MVTAHLVINPASGALISDRVKVQVLSLLKDVSSLGLQLVEHETQSEGDGYSIGKEIASKCQKEWESDLKKEGKERERMNEGDGHAATGNDDDAINLIVLGGDGTTHELLDGIFNPNTSAQGEKRKLPRVNLTIVPIGTSNALYHSIYPPESQKQAFENEGKDQYKEGREADDEDSWRFNSLGSMIHTLKSETSNQQSLSMIPLTLSLTKHIPVQSTQTSTQSQSQAQSESSPSISNPTQQTTISHLLTSHSLHASILKDSELLRQKIPTIERFKIAAQQNSIRWTSGEVTLQGQDGDEKDSIMKYDRKRKEFVSIEGEDHGEEMEGDKLEMKLKGPFIYLICLSIDRLEPSFIPAPFSSNHSNVNEQSQDPLTRPSDYLDVLMIRPLRDPSVRRNLLKVQGGLSSKKKSHDKAGSDAFEIEDEADFWSSSKTLNLRTKFAETRLGEITVGMYSGGKHVDLGYKPENSIPTEEASDEEATSLTFDELDKDSSGEGEEVVEYYRCKGYEWNPVSFGIPIGIIFKFIVGGVFFLN